MLWTIGITGKEKENKKVGREIMMNLDREFTIQDFKICSTEMDDLLFFCSSYQKAVTEAINKIMQKVEWNDKLTLYCYRSMIEIKDKNHNPTVFEWEMLGIYNTEHDVENFTLGYIAI